MDKNYRMETLAVRAGAERSQFGEHSEALYLTSSFVFKSAAAAAARFSNKEPGNIYSRFTNPTVTTFEQRLAALEDAECCVATASGMAAILSCVMGLLKSGDHIVCSAGVFGATVQLLGNIMKRFGVEATFVSGNEPAKWQAAAKPNTRMLYLETPSNPLTEVYDITALAAVARKAGALLVVDNCFCSPALQQPLALGADVVVHSTTKYINGHSDVVGGAVIAREPAIAEKLKWWGNCLGLTGAPFDSWLTLRGLRTLSARLRAHQENAAALAHLLNEHPATTRVFYPGLASHPQHALAKRQQSGFGAMLSFELAGGEDAVRAFLDGLQCITLAESLGGVESLVAHPATMTHAAMAPEARRAAGISDTLLRLSVGIEDIADLSRHLRAALARADAVSRKRVAVPA